MDEYTRELHRVSIVKMISLKMAIALKGSEFQRVGMATEQALVHMFVSTLGTKRRSELDD